MELQHFSHTHPLLFNEELSHESDEKVNCAGCGELLSGPNFSCLGCKFYLHKQCAEAPSQINHPFHPNHSFQLLKNHPYSGTCPCDFCKKPCENFVYHCSSTCQLDLHIKCALLSNKIADKRIAELQHIPRVDPLISVESCNTEELKKAECFACWKPLLDSVFLSPDCGFYLHTKCLHLTAEINHLFHPQHPLVLQLNSERLPCNICQKTQWRGLVYCCPSCKFVLHIHCASLPTQISQLYHRKHPLILQFVSETLPCQMCQELIHLKAAVYFCSFCKFVVHSGCASPPSSIENKIRHDHPFILFQRQASICDACGTSGNYVPYVCLTCNLIVHKKCISLPRIIRFYRHQHRLFHTYFLPHESETLECRCCHEDVKTSYGSYFCSMCNYIVHVNCALQERYFYHEVEQTEEEEAMDVTAYSRVTATCIKHFSHDHNLSLCREDDKDEKQCDGCSLLISTHYYFCLQCDYFLHESCAELPLKKHVWFYYPQEFLRLSLIGIFKCTSCRYENSGFAYICDDGKYRYCLQCTSFSDIPKCEGHKHPLPYYFPYNCVCNGCGRSSNHAFRCKTCDFNLEGNCLSLPLKVRHKSDDHLYKLTYHDNSNYSECNYCDICEKERNLNYWFYHCSICDNSVHPQCVIGKYLYIKLGSIYTKVDHPHPLTFVQKVEYYPECDRCGQSCLDLALECKKIGCNYIAHWECIKPAQL